MAKSFCHALNVKKSDLKKVKLPDSPGVYFFIGGIKSKSKEKEIFYVGKATSLRDRVKSYFSENIEKTRGQLIAKMIREADVIKHEKTDSVLEALILEARYIKKYKPHFNSLAKDDKSYNYVYITKERFPAIGTIREHEIENDSKNGEFMALFGPFPNGGQLMVALKIIRKIFPFRDSKCKVNQGKPCFNRQIGLCPGVCTGDISQKQYLTVVKNIIRFFNGKKKEIVRDLNKQMKSSAKLHRFEKAGLIKKQIFALNHIHDVSLIRESGFLTIPDVREKNFRIEAYDIAHTSGEGTVGTMAVIEDGVVKKDEFRRFKIRGGNRRINDTANLKEVLVRRLGHFEWSLPSVIVIDGGVAQLNTALKVLKERNFNIELVSVVKNEKHKPKELIGKKKHVEKYKKEILLANSEAHRFANKYHRGLLRRQFRAPI